MDYAITTDALSKSFGRTLAVHQLSLRVPAGSIFGFLGPNGAGKTTTIRMLLGLIRQTSGTATVCGRDIDQQRKEIASLVGAIVEVPCFYPYLTAEENLQAIALTAGLKLAGAEVSRLLGITGLTQSKARRVREYSLGMKQRLGIAAALIGDPPVLFLDEPTNGLDPEGSREMRDLLASIKSAGRTIFFSSHLLGEVERICTDIAILQSGEVRVQGPVTSLLSEQGVEIRLSSTKRAAALLALPAPESMPAGPGWLRVDGTDETIPATLRTLLNAGIDVFEVRAKRVTLEALFFASTSPGAGVQQ